MTLQAWRQAAADSVCAATHRLRNAGFQGYLSITVCFFPVSHWERAQARAGDASVPCARL